MLGPDKAVAVHPGTLRLLADVIEVGPGRNPIHWGGAVQKPYWRVSCRYGWILNDNIGRGFDGVPPSDTEADHSSVCAAQERQGRTIPFHQNDVPQWKKVRRPHFILYGTITNREEELLPNKIQLESLCPKLLKKYRSK